MGDPRGGVNFTGLDHADHPPEIRGSRVAAGEQGNLAAMEIILNIENYCNDKNNTFNAMGAGQKS